MKTLARFLIILHFLLYFQSLWAAVQLSSSPVFRLEGDIHNPQVDRFNRYLAFTNQQGQSLRILNLSSGEVHEITKQNVGLSYFWAPNGYRLFYRELYQTNDRVESRILAFDLKLKVSVEIEKIEGLSGYLSFDPRDLNFFLIHKKGILSKKIVYPDERLARWQKSSKDIQGRWVISQQKILWLTNHGLSIAPLKDDSSGIQSFNLSPDGRTMVWATKNQGIYISKDGQNPKHLAQGIDPRWHPRKPMIVFAAPRTIGHQVLEYDISVIDLLGRKKNLTQSSHRTERWPIWFENGERLLYTIQNSTDLFLMDFQP